MSINQYSSDTPETTTLWWTQQQNTSTPGPPIHPQLYQQQSTWVMNSDASAATQRFNLNNVQDEDEVEEEEEGEGVVEQGSSRRMCPQEEEREAMFEKALTPSDVGKLNRLVIPKQHAEKYFPLDSGESKGLLLSFEDESGRCWRFRYSYWNSSQSYVLTKGWSRYVKDKRLHAGDVLLFHRHRSDAHRFFIAWRRRHPPAHLSPTPICTTSSDGNGNGAVPVGWTRGFYPAHPYPAHHHSLPYQTDSLHSGGGGSQGQNQSTGGANSSSPRSRVLRLFGVNMECQLDNDSETFPPECSYNMSSTQGTAAQQFYHHQPSYSSSDPHHHMVRQQPY